MLLQFSFQVLLLILHTSLPSPQSSMYYIIIILYNPFLSIFLSFLYAGIYVCVCVYIYVYICMYMCIYIYMYMCVYIYVCVCIDMYIYICICVCACNCCTKEKRWKNIINKLLIIMYSYNKTKLRIDE